MQTLANYDPYAIEEIQFFVQKKNKYTTLKSVIVTIGILALTIFLNYGVIQHLWIPRNQLPLVTASRKMSLQTITQGNYFCVFAKKTTDSLPKTNLININYVTNQTLKTYTITDKFVSHPDIVNVAKGRNSICYDIEGAQLTRFIILRLTVYSTTANLFEFMYKTYSPSQLIGSQASNYYYKFSNATTTSLYQYSMKKISALYYDQLLIDYQPQRVMGLSTRFDELITMGGTDSTVQLMAQVIQPFDLTDQYILTRYNISEIIGKTLSWFSVFVMMCAFVVSPILDYNYRLQLSKKLYDNQKLNAIDLSLMSYVKYLLSKLKKRLFNQDILETAFQRLEKDLDLLNMIKKQALMKKLIKQNQCLNVHPKQGQNQVTQFNMFDMSEVLLQKELALSENGNNQQELRPSNSSKRQIQQCPIITQPDEQSQDNFLIRLIKGFDIGQVQISLISNKGQGYKTSWNTIISIFFLCAVLWFIVFAGLFNLGVNYTVQTIAALNDDTIYPQVTLNPQDIIFRANKSLTANFNLSVVLVDKWDKIVDTLVLLNGTACDSYAIGLNQTAGGGWMCLSQPITLLNNGYDNKIRLGMRFVYKGLALASTNIQVKIAQYNLMDNQLVKKPQYIRQFFSSTQLYYYNAQCILYDDDQNQDGPTMNLIMNQFYVSSDTVFKGVLIQLHHQFIRVKKTNPSLWDVINNAWGLVVLSFSVFLSKITKYINVKQRQKITHSEENQNRNDIVAIISTQYKLIYRVFYEELKQIKYYYKTNMNDLQFKDF